MNPLFFRSGVRIKRRGFGAIEIVVGASLISVVLFLSLDVMTRFLKTGSSQVERTKALYLTEETLESVRFVRDADWVSFEALPLSTNLYIVWSGSGAVATITPQVIGTFTPVFQIFAVKRDASTKDIVSSGGVVDTKTRFITASTTWASGGITLSTYLADISP